MPVPYLPAAAVGFHLPATVPYSLLPDGVSVAGGTPVRTTRSFSPAGRLFPAEHRAVFTDVRLRCPLARRPHLTGPDAATLLTPLVLTPFPPYLALTAEPAGAATAAIFTIPSQHHLPPPAPYHPVCCLHHYHLRACLNGSYLTVHLRFTRFALFIVPMGLCVLRHFTCGTGRCCFFGLCTCYGSWHFSAPCVVRCLVPGTTPPACGWQHVDTFTLPADSDILLPLCLPLFPPPCLFTHSLPVPYALPHVCVPCILLFFPTFSSILLSSLQTNHIPIPCFSFAVYINSNSNVWKRTQERV